MNTLYTIYNPKLNRLGTGAWGGENTLLTSELIHRAADGLMAHSTERERLCCLTSTEARRPVRDGDEWEKGS